MYNPVKDGIEKTMQSVSYVEAKPPDDLSNFVHCVWGLKTETNLTDDFYLHVLPDACVNILFNLKDPNIAAVTARQTTYIALNLGKTFHYAGIQFLPGVWQGDRNEIVNGFVDKPYTGTLELVEIGSKLTSLNFSNMQPVMFDLVRQLINNRLVVANATTAKILADINSIHTVGDMATIAGTSPRQLQRIIKQATGFSPHDLLKVLRLQQSFREHYLASYTDQSHFIRSFRKITGYTPKEYFKNFDV